jgi:hypothetical protein
MEKEGGLPRPIPSTGKSRLTKHLIPPSKDKAFCSGYQIFARQYCAALRIGQMNGKKMVVECSRRWRTMSLEERRPFVEECGRLKSRGGVQGPIALLPKETNTPAVDPQSPPAPNSLIFSVHTPCQIRKVIPKQELDTFDLIYRNALSTQSTLQLYGRWQLPRSERELRTIAAERAVADMTSMYNLSFSTNTSKLLFTFAETI